MNPKNFQVTQRHSNLCDAGAVLIAEVMGWNPVESPEKFSGS